jgi:hypothetical protein
VNPDLQRDIQELLSELRVVRSASLAHGSITPPADCSTETICAWVAAGKEGDVEALAHLFRLQNSITGVLSSTDTSSQVSVAVFSMQLSVVDGSFADPAVNVVIS